MNDPFHAYETVPEWLGFCGDMLRVWAPEFCDFAGPYLVRQPLRSFKAFAIPGADLMFREEIAAGWKGRGPAIIIDANRLYADRFAEARAAGESVEGADQAAKLALMATILHEATHFLTESNFIGEPFCTRPVFAQIDAQFSSPQLKSTGIPWGGHGAVFIRTLLHLLRRAAAFGYRPKSEDWCIGGPQFGLSPRWTYAEALRDELKERCGGRLAGIIASRPPRDFIDLWRNDIKTWWRRLSDTATSEQEQAALDALRLFS